MASLGPLKNRFCRLRSQLEIQHAICSPTPVPFGGFKQSGNGRDKSLHAFDKYTELKTTWLRIDGE